MKACPECGVENEDAASHCQACGVELAPGMTAAKEPAAESNATERFERIAGLDNEVQAELMGEVLASRGVPHILQSYHDSALDGIFQAGKGWGVILAPARFREEILGALADIRRQSQAVPEAPEGNNA